MPTTTSSKDIYALSVSRWFDPFVSVALIIGAFFLFRGTPLSNVQLSLILILVPAIYLFASEFSRASWTWAGRPRQPILAVIERTCTKFLGVLVGIAALFFAVWLFPEYDSPRNLQYLEEAVLPFLVFFIPVSLALIFITEFILGGKEDGTYQFGLLVRGRVRDINWNTFLDGALEWIVRCIFLLINFFSATYLLSSIRTSTLRLGDTFVEKVINLDGLIFTLILFSILPGYVFASRLIQTEVKKIDRSWFGWTVTLAAYSPINAAVFTSWMGYTSSPELRAAYEGVPAWAYAAGDSAAMLYALGALIILTALLHLWSEALLGIRSANLSMRGVITTGPFRMTKHPVYVSKCLQWACIYLPFFGVLGFLNILQASILFILVCVLFAARSLAEEKLLAQDPDYVRYALYMDSKSWFAFVGRLLPFMRFEWRYEFWKRNGYLPSV